MRQPDLLGSRSDFAALMSDLGDPVVQFGQLRIAGRAGWESAADRSTPMERRQILRLPPVRRALLLASPYGRERVRRRRDVERPPAPLPERRAWVSDRVMSWGDASLHEVIVAGLVRLPDLVCASAVHETAWLLVGCESVAWTSSAQFAVLDRAAPHRVVVAGPNITPRTIRHEAGHVFHSPIDDARYVRTGMSIAGQSGYAAFCEQNGLTAQVSAATQHQERLAEAFAISWGPET